MSAPTLSPSQLGPDISPVHADPDHAGALHHVELYAADLKRPAAFWGWLLGELG